MILLDSGPSGRGWSFRSAALRCPQEWACQHLLRRSRGTNDALIAGALVHTALAHHFARRQAAELGEDPEAYHAPGEAARLVAAREDEAHGDREWTAHLGRSLALFADWTDKVPGTVFAVEHYVHAWVTVDGIVDPPPDADARLAFAHGPDPCALARLGPPYLHSARMDLVTEEYGRLYVYDHKTCGSADAKKIAGHTADGQLVGLAVMGARSWGTDFGGVRMSYMPWNRSYKLQRISVSGRGLRKWAASVVRSEEVIAQYADRDPRDWPCTSDEQVCVRRYGDQGLCPFYAFCWKE